MEYKRVLFDEYRDQISDVRRKVFIEEQKCPVHTEWNEQEDADSIYFICLKGERVVGIARIRNVGKDLRKLERVAVLNEFRRRGICSELIRNAMIYVQTTQPDASIYAYAQVYAIQVYVNLGFSVISNVWVEDETFLRHQTIFWSHPQAVQRFLENEKARSPESIEGLQEYDVHHPKMIAKIEKYKERLENFGNLQTLHLHLDDWIISRILRQRFGRFANISFSSENFEKEYEFLAGLADEKLNTGHFNEVDENWRIFYSLVSYVKCVHLFENGNYEEAINLADKGLCMGRIDEEKVAFRKLAYIIHSCLDVPKIKIHPKFLEILKSKKFSTNNPIAEFQEEDGFEKLIEAVQNQKPVIIRNFAKNMNAFDKWSFEFLLSELHSRTFPVEIGSKYSDENWSQKMMSFSDFLKNEENETVYLAQHRIFDQVPSLKEDLIIPDVCFLTEENPENIDINMWCGPSGTVSPLHTDPRNNVFVQIFGSKIVKMVDPKESEFVYP
ncbi:unnamed protein product [Caenorhabditis angaria]|uniref:N-acetyltransferase domain-containing protein n=1 Tax=Caenorhabditis angaria TaxID=860376 RepID=A0A9P1ISN7_9PELO|nr:unnamed protein product [Caenorhabditis angaria]